MSIARNLARSTVTLVALAAAILPACSGGVDTPPSGSKSTADTDPSGVEVDSVEIVRGVPDKGRDPAVVAIDVAGIGLCSGTLVAPGVVLTARHCVSETVEGVACPSSTPQILRDRAPATLAIYAGETIESARLVARGASLVVPRGNVLCDADIAAIVLDQAVDGVAPVDVARSGPDVGARVRAVGFGKAGEFGSAGAKLLRDQVLVQAVSKSEFLVGEATCHGDSGGPALDGSGDLVGVVSRGGPSCNGPSVHNVYTRADAFASLVAEAKSVAAKAAETGVVDLTPPTKSDAGAPKGGKPATDFGEPCRSGSECSTGLCVRSGGAAYCSRPCGATNHCPAHYHCVHTKSGKSACAAS